MPGAEHSGGKSWGKEEEASANYVLSSGKKGGSKKFGKNQGSSSPKRGHGEILSPPKHWIIISRWIIITKGGHAKKGVIKIFFIGVPSGTTVNLLCAP